MTSALTGPTTDDVDEHVRPRDRAPARVERWLYRVVTLVAVLPIFIAAVRRGLAGWEPTWDSATTMVRIRDVFSAHPPLIGMAAAPSSGSSAVYSFPGAMHLYLLALPVELFGTTWGGLLGVAVLNSAMCVAALWLIRRMLGETWALVAAVFLAAFLWAVGDAAPVLFTPLAMGVVPLFAFLVAAWAVASGDGPALIVFAFVGNYLFLDQLVFVVVVPVVGATALAFFLVRLRRARRTDPEAGVIERRRTLRWLLGASALTIVVWIPPLVDQFVHGSGNLGKIIHSFTTGQVAARQGAAATPTLPDAFGVVASVVATPRWWLPPTFGEPPFNLNGGGGSPTVRLVWTLVLVAVLAWIAVRARRRGDSSLTSAVAVVCAGWIAFIVTAWQNPDPLGFSERYLLGLWPFSAFTSMVVCLGIFRGRGLRARIGASAAKVGSVVLPVAVVAFVVLGIVAPSRSPSALAASRNDPRAARVRAAVASGQVGPGPVLVTADFKSRKLFPSVMLGLQDAGIPIRVAGAFDQQQFGAFRSHRRGDDTRARIVVSERPHDAPKWKHLATLPLRHGLSDAEFERIDRKMRAWARSLEVFTLAPSLRIDVETRAEFEAALAGLVAEHGGDITATMESDAFLEFMTTFGNDDGDAVFDIPGVSGPDFAMWARDTRVRRGAGTVYLYVTPM